MAHVAKHTKIVCGKLMSHYNRRKIDGEYIKFGNQNIDTIISDFNYNLAPPRESQFKFLGKNLMKSMYLIVLM